jgi:hypothetical protein
MFNITHHMDRSDTSTRCLSVDMTASRKTDEDGKPLTNKYGQPLWFAHPVESYTIKNERTYLVQFDGSAGPAARVMTKVEMRQEFGAKATAQALDRYSRSVNSTSRRDG